MIASDPPQVVHLITRAQGGLHDYQALLHEAGHALHYAGCDPALPYTFRRLARDHALTEIYSFLVESITREPGWHAEHFRLDEAEAEEQRRGRPLPRGAPLPPLRREARLRARALERLRQRDGLRGPVTPSGCEPPSASATGPTTTSRTWTTASTRRTTSEPGSGRRSCAPTSARTIGEDWWQRPETGAFLRDLFREGTKPSSEEIARRLGFDPLDTEPLVDELAVAA